MKKKEKPISAGGTGFTGKRPKDKMVAISSGKMPKEKPVKI